MSTHDWAFWFLMIISSNFFAHDKNALGLFYLVLAAMASNGLMKWLLI